jgi:pimeloyl-ACP methyl ester carboxylesterase
MCADAGRECEVSTFVLIHGASSDSWYWHRVAPLLTARGHDVVAPDLPSDDDRAGLAEYTDAVLDAIGDRTDLVVVGQSLGGFTAPLVCARRPVDLLILVAPMIPSPREPPGAWFVHTGWVAARGNQPPDPKADFFNDVPADVTDEAWARGERAQSGTPMEQPWPLDAWPAVPTRVLLCRDDRFFPIELMRRVAKERLGPLGITADEMDSGHLPALAHPDELADRLDAYAAS